MKKKWARRSLLSYFLVFALSLFIFSGCGQKTGQNIAEDSSSQDEAVEFSEEVNRILEQKKMLLKDFAADPMVIRFVKESNKKNKDHSASDIADLDKKWQEADGIDDFIKPYITNDCALYLVSFQDNHDVFSEIFITDIKGLIIGETNKTSDFYQADEDWWVQTYNNGTGNEFYGEIEYDESSRSEAIPVYVPVFDPETKVVIGVIKAVCDITAIKLEL